MVEKVVEEQGEEERPAEERMRRIARGVAEIRRRGWTRPDPIAATRDVVGPLVIGLLGMLVGPPLAAAAVDRALGGRWAAAAGRVDSVWEQTVRARVRGRALAPARARGFGTVVPSVLE